MKEYAQIKMYHNNQFFKVYMYDFMNVDPDTMEEGDYYTEA